MTTICTPIFDPGSPYADLRAELVNGYFRITVKGHPLADSRGRVMAHRAVLWDAIGDGPHDCHWCEWPGLRWDVDRRDPVYLVVDHLDGVSALCTLENLSASCSWCNNNRSVVERLGIPWSSFRGVPPGARGALRNKHDGSPTSFALALAGQVRTRHGQDLIETEPVPVLTPPAPPVAPSSRVGGWVVWPAVVDVAGLDRGDIRLVGPPAELLAAHPELASVDFSRFGR